MNKWIAFGVAIVIASPASAQVCPEGRAASGDLGIRGLLCTGAAVGCSIYLRAGGEYQHRFSVEPRIEIVDQSAAGDMLRAGDVIVAIDSLMITTTEGGRRLASVRPRQSVRVLIRREGALLEQVIVAQTGCGITQLTVRTRR
jgi:hypothetical protein